MQCHRAGFLRGSRLRGSPTADDDAKRRLLEIVCFNCTLDGATLVRELRKPFDVLAEGLLSEKVGATGFEIETENVGLMEHPWLLERPDVSILERVWGVLKKSVAGFVTAGNQLVLLPA
jgi:hypothetical protein